MASQKLADKAPVFEVDKVLAARGHHEFPFQVGQIEGIEMLSTLWFGPFWCSLARSCLEQLANHTAILQTGEVTSHLLGLIQSAESSPQYGDVRTGGGSRT